LALQINQPACQLLTVVLGRLFGDVGRHGVILVFKRAGR
jgi:hypothetical protein